MLNPFIERRVSSPSIDLRPAGNACFHFMLQHVKGDLLPDFLHDPRTFRARPDDTHLSLDDIEELWQLIQTRLAEKAANARHPRIILRSEQNGVTGLVD